MNKFFLIPLFLIASFVAQAQTFDVDTVIMNGAVEERINLVFLGDGYTEGEQVKFLEDIDGILDEMFNQPPFKEYKNYFNAFAVKVISSESGADHPQNSTDGDTHCLAEPKTNVNNYFGSTYDFAEIHRLLYPKRLSKVFAVLRDNFPLYDQAFLIVNSPYHGGGGGDIAAFSTNSSSREAAIHEFGHSFAGLADEYWAGVGSEAPNMTMETHPSVVRWKNWMGVSGVGIYPHTGDPAWKKPHLNCKMGVLNVPLCKVCVETFVERFHLLVKPIRAFTPANEQTIPVPEQSIDFSVSLIHPEPSTLKVVWEKDNRFLAKQVESISLAVSEIKDPTRIRVTVTDTTELTRSETHSTSHVYVVEWEISNPVTGIEIIPVEKRYKISVFPNPADTELNFEYTLSKAENVQVTLLDINGRKVKSLVNSRQAEGTHGHTFPLKAAPLNPGEYLLQFTFGKVIVAEKILVR